MALILSKQLDVSSLLLAKVHGPVIKAPLPTKGVLFYLVFVTGEVHLRSC